MLSLLKKMMILDSADGFKKSEHDAYVEHCIAQHCDRHGIDPLTALKLFPVLARRQALKRYLAHVELFKMTLDVPGDIAEFGVYRGAGLFTWANLLEAYCIGDRTKVVYGFEDWVGFGEFRPAPFKREVLGAIAIFDDDRFIPHKMRIKLVDGDITKTAPQFVRDNPGVRFSLVHLDCDLYEPTKAALEAMWDCVVPGGIVIFDEYGIPDWPGETAAVDKFLSSLPKQPGLRTFNWTNTPGAYIVKV